MLRCPVPTCPGHGSTFQAAVAAKLGGTCPLCGTPLASLRLPGDPSVEHLWPTPVAVPYARMRAAGDATTVALHAVEAGTGLLKLLALGAVAQYLQGEGQDASVNQALEVELSRSLVSSWKRLLDVLVPFLEVRGDLFTPALPAAWRACEDELPLDARVHLDGGWYDELGALHAGGADHGLVTAFIALRNRLAHGVIPPPEEARRQAEQLVAVLDRLLGAHAWLLEFNLFRVHDGAVQELRGSGPLHAVPTARPSPNDPSLYFQRQDARRLDLYPLFLVPQEIVAEQVIDDGVLLYEKDLGTRILYLGPHGVSVPTRTTLARWRDLLDKKKVITPRVQPAELSARDLQARAATASARTLRALEATSAVIPDGYEPRRAPETLLLNWALGTTPLLLLEASGGAGKSALLAQLAKVLAAQGHVVIHLRAIDCHEPSIEGALRAHLQVGDQVRACHLAERAPAARQAFVLVDGLDEHREGPKWLPDAERIALETPTLRILLSARPDVARDPLGAREHPSLWWTAEGRANAGMPSTTAARAKAPSVRLEPLAWSESVEVWKRMGAARGLKPWFGAEQLRQRYRLVTRSLTSPLWIRLYLEAFDGRALPKKFKYGDAVKLRMERAAEQAGDDGRLLRAIARRALESPRGDLLLDALIDDPAIGPAIRSRDIRSPYRRLLYHRLLVERGTEAGTVVTSGLPSLVAQAAGDALVEEGAAETPAALAEIHARFKGEPLAFEATRRALQRRVDAVGFAFLCEFVDLAGEGVRHSAGVVVASWIRDGGDPADAARQLTEHLTDADLVVIASAAEDLRDMRDPIAASALLEVAATHPELGRCSPLARASLHEERADCARQAGRLDQAVEARRAELEARRAVDSEDPAAVGMVRMSLAQELHARGLLDEARVEAELALREWTTESHGEELTLTRNLLGVIALDQSRWDDAELHFQYVLEQNTRIHGADSGELIAPINNLAIVAIDAGRLSAAHALLKIAVELQAAHLVPDDPQIGTIQSNLGRYYLATGDVHSARRSLRLALEITTSAGGPEHPDVARLLGLLAGVEQVGGNHEEASRLLSRAVVLNAARGGDSAPGQTSLLAMLVESEVVRGETVSLQPLLARTHAALASAPDPRASTVLLHTEGLLAESSGDLEHAEHWFRRAITAAREGLPDGNALHWMTRAALGRSLIGLGRAEEAEAELTIALGACKAVGSLQTSAGRLALWTSARARWELGNAIGVTELLDGPLAAPESLDNIIDPAVPRALRVAAAAALGEPLERWQQRVDELEALRASDPSLESARGEAWLLELDLLVLTDARAAQERRAVIDARTSEPSARYRARTAWALGTGLAEASHHELAIPVLEECLALELECGLDAESTRATRLALTNALEGAGRLANAIAMGESALESLRAENPDDERIASWTEDLAAMRGRG